MDIIKKVNKRFPGCKILHAYTGNIGGFDVHAFILDEPYHLFIIVDDSTGKISELTSVPVIKSILGTLTEVR